MYGGVKITAYYIYSLESYLMVAIIGNMLTMLLERRLVTILWNENWKRGNKYNKEEFVEFIGTKKWPRWNYLFRSKDNRFRNKISFILEDCVEYGYIISAKKLQEDEELSTQKLKVSKAGRDFLKFGGFFEEYFKRRKRYMNFFFGGAFGLIIGLIYHFWPYIKSII